MVAPFSVGWRHPDDRGAGRVSLEFALVDRGGLHWTAERSGIHWRPGLLSAGAAMRVSTMRRAGTVVLIVGVTGVLSASAGATSPVCVGDSPFTTGVTGCRIDDGLTAIHIVAVGGSGG
jgi:hypothetical protein